MTPRAIATGAAVLLLLVATVPFGIAAARPASEATAPGAGFGVGPVTPHEPRTDAWAAIARDLEPVLDPGSSNPCTAGELHCLEAVVTEMEARLDELGCAHPAPFAFTYLETTRGVDDHLARDGLFEDPAEIAHLDALFAVLYFDAIDNWQAGRHDQVPPAWQMAFAAADDRRVTAAVDVMLGMNAHISRDLAYAVARQRGEDPRPRDHDPTDFFRIDDVIQAVQQPMLEGAAARFDPHLATLSETLIPAEAAIDSAALIGLWREQAYGFGVRLAAADGPDERAAVAAEIERAAVASAVLILNVGVTRDLGLAVDARERYCSEQATGG